MTVGCPPCVVNNCFKGHTYWLDFDQISNFKPSINKYILDQWQTSWTVVVDFLFIVTPIVGVCNCSMFCYTFRFVLSSIAIILMGKREPIALLILSSWCLVMVERLFLAVPRVDCGL